MQRARIRSAAVASALGCLVLPLLHSQTSAPTLTSARGFFDPNNTLPNTPYVTAGASGFTLVLTGTGFAVGTAGPATTVTWIPSAGGCPISNCTISATSLGTTQIRVDIPAALIANPDATARVSAANVNGPASNSLVFPVNPPISASASLPNGAVGVAYSATLFTGGSQPYGVFRETGQLPPGLALPTTGNLLTGTPTAAGTYVAGLIYDDAWQTGGGIVDVTITTAAVNLTFTPSTFPDGQVGTAYSQSLTASGGSAPYAFAVAQGSLPPGLTLSSAGALTGTPTAAGAYTFSIGVSDEPGNSGSGSRSITINPAPAGIGLTPATLPGGQLLLTYSVTLQGTGGTAPYTFQQVSGALPPGISLVSSGELSGVPVFAGTYSFGVRVTDAAQRNATVALSITVSTSSGTVFFTPTTLTDATVGVAYAKDLTGGGGTAPYTFAIASGVLPQGLTLSTAGAIRGVPQTAGTYSTIVRVTDVQGASGTAVLSITVTTGLQIVTTALPAFFPFQAYFAQMIATGGQPPYSWFIQGGSLPSGLVLNAATGLISGTPDADSGSSVTIAARDFRGIIAARTFDIPIGVRPPQLASTELPAANVGSPYSFVLIATGGSGALTWVLDSGTLPPGLLLSPLGTIAGTPSAVGDYPFVLRVFDTGGRFSVSPVHLLVNAPLLSITTGPLPAVPAGLVGIVFAAAGGTPPYTWSLGAGSLPPGLTLSPGGVLNGAATSVGSYDFRVVVTDARRNTVSRGYTLVVTVAPLVLATRSLPSGALGVAYSAPLSGEGGTPPYRWSATGLPPGLSLPQGASTIGGTPTTDGSYRVALQLADSGGLTASVTLALEIAPPPVLITTRSLAPAAVGQPYSASFTASGGTPPYNWLVSGNAPAGLRMSSDGVLSGTPASAGSFQFTVIASDARGSIARQEVTLEVRIEPLGVSTQGLPGGTVGQRYSQTVAASGGIPPYVWGGTLPAGLAIDPSTGAITGTPTAAGAATFAIVVTDSTRATAAATFSASFGLPALPAVSLSGPPDAANPLQQTALQLSFGTAFPVPVSGTVTLAFRGDTGADDAAVQFSTGGRTVTFTIPANATQAVFSVSNLGLQMGTTAGVLTLSTRLLAGTVDVTPNPAPSRQVRVNPGPPVITSVRVTRTTGGFEVQVVGYSSTRELAQAQFRFAAAPGAQLQTTDLTVPADAVFATWYGSAASAATGSQFTYTQPFNVQGSPTAVQSVTVTLTNRQGASQAVPASLQ